MLKIYLKMKTERGKCRNKEDAKILRLFHVNGDVCRRTAKKQLEKLEI